MYLVLPIADICHQLTAFRLIVVENDPLVFIFTWLFLLYLGCRSNLKGIKNFLPTFLLKSFLIKPSICAKFERTCLVPLGFLVDKLLIFRWYKGTIMNYFLCPNIVY